MAAGAAERSAGAQVCHYEVLAVERTASRDEIKKAFYLRMRENHPDKNLGDPEEAHLKTVRINEAYSVLYNSEKRALYDQGKLGGPDSDSFSAEQVEHHVTLALEIVFGAGAFDDVFGRLMFHSIFLRPEVGPEWEGRKQTLVANLLKKFDLMLALGPSPADAAVDKLFESELALKQEAPGGASLLEMLSHVYQQESYQHLSTLGFMSTMKEKAQRIGSVVFALSDAVRAISSFKEVAAGMSKMNSPVAADLVVHALRLSFTSVWRIGCLEIDWMMRLVCEHVLGDESIDAATRQQRCLSMQRLGEAYGRAARAAERAGTGLTMAEELEKADRQAKLDENTRKTDEAALEFFELKRQAELLNVKCPEGVRVLLLPYAGAGGRFDIPVLSSSKFVLPPSWTFGLFVLHVRQLLASGDKVAQAAQLSLVFYVGPNHIMCPASMTLEDVFQKHQSEDGFLHVTYATEAVFGN